MSHHVVIVGAGMGGLTAAIRLARRGNKVTVFESRSGPGGLAASLEIEGMTFDAGPYVLLDKPGLEWAFDQLGIDLADPLSLQRVGALYQSKIHGEEFSLFDSLDQTADAIEKKWPGSGARYRELIRRTLKTYQRLQPLQIQARPGLGRVIRCGVWRDIPFLLRSLRSLLDSSGLPQPVIEGLAIWTHVAGQTLETAPSPLGLVPAVIHHVGAWYPQGGIGRIPEVLFQSARGLGVEFHFDTPIRRINCERSASSYKATGVETADGSFVRGDAVISDVGIGTYLRLIDDGVLPPKQQLKFKSLPLQSPGICVYLAVKGDPPPVYLQFRVHDQPDGCRLLIQPSVVDGSINNNDWRPARLIAPMNHQRAEAGGETGQREFLDSVLAEEWWQGSFDEVRILKTRIPQEWGSSYHLFRNSMNPVMTAAFMRAGRISHRSPWIQRLYLAGSATHPGQWVSFCAVSGILAADNLQQDLGI